MPRNMPITLDSRRDDDIAVVTCSGRIVQGEESLALQYLLDDLLPINPDVILHLGGIDSIDSNGLGLLVRYAARARHVGGRLRFCAVSAKLAEVLRITKLDTVFDRYASEAEARAAIVDHRTSASTPPRNAAEILCVESSPDVQAYVRELLGLAGYPVMSAGNLPDALTLLQASRPKLVIVGAELRQARGTHSAERFNRLADALTVIELGADFSKRDAGYAGHALVKQVRAALPLTGHAKTAYA
jgi:anti-sigma B factor antagonist